MSQRKVVLTRPVRSAPSSLSSSSKEAGEGDRPPLPLYRGEEGGLTPVVVCPHDALQQATDLANKLTRQDLKKLYDHIALALATSSGERDRDLAMWSTAAYDALVRANGGSPAGMPGPLVVRRLLGARSSWVYVEDFLAALGGDELRPAERLSVLRLLAKLLVIRCQDIARHARIPLNAKLLANNCHDVAAVFEDSFPGYLGAGLTPLLVKCLVAGGGHAD